jgi:hypothetical protein
MSLFKTKSARLVCTGAEGLTDCSASIIAIKGKENSKRGGSTELRPAKSSYHLVQLRGPGSSLGGFNLMYLMLSNSGYGIVPGPV